MNRTAMQRSFLFLQGPGSPLFPLLGRALLRAGQQVLRVNFCGGDLLFGLGLPSVSYRGPQSKARGFFDALLAQKEVTDVVLFGDCRPIHRLAMDAARAWGARIHVFEEGYIRPNWITLERDGVNGHSSLPRDPAFFLKEAAGLPERQDRKMPGGFKRRVLFDILYYAANGLCLPFFPRFRTHRLCPMPLEYAGWLRRLFLRMWRGEERRAVETTARVLRRRLRYYLFPLQLDTDFQLRSHSPFGRLNPAIETVLASFAAHAPGDALLLVKNHPLDNGMVDLRRFVERAARRLGVAERVLFLDGGHLPTLFSQTRGVVVVNSTVGFSALINRKPVKTLGAAFYDMPGLTFQGPLDAFWRQGQPPDAALVTAVRRVVLARTQINGNLFTRGGLATAVPLAVARLTAPEPKA